MNLPDAGQATVDRGKITKYLLSEEHPAGRSKAFFFRHFGSHPDLRGTTVPRLVTAYPVE